MRKTVLAALCALCIVLAAASLSSAATNLMLIFDASGSMWGQIDGKAKITIAKEAMDLIVNDLPPDINIGLVAYGHRRKGDCDDVETLIPLGPLNAKTFLAKVNSLNPKGKTPMVRSIRKTADGIKHLEDETTILLVSDGEETCDPDPCNFVAELEKLGIKFTLHVVGFDVGGQTEAQLQCMAKAGGGEYFPAKDAAKLKGALDTVVKKVVARNLVVSSFDEKNAPVSARVKVLDQAGNIVDSDAGKRVGFGLAPGSYTITVKPETMSETKTISGIVVTEDKVTERKVVFAKAQIIVSMKDGAGKNIPGYVRIIDMKTRQMAEAGDHTGKSTGFIVSPGDYEVLMECSNTRAKVTSKPFTLHAGENRNVNGVCADARIGVLVLGDGDQPVTGYIRIVDVPRDTYVEQEDSRSSMRFFEVPPGKYKVDVECPSGTRLRSLPFTLQAGEENRVTINCSSQVIKTTLSDESTGSAKPGGAAATNAPKQTARETVPQTAAPANSQDMQATAAQMQAQAEAQAAAAQADAMAQMQTALGGMNTRPDVPSPKQTERETVSGVGAQPTGHPVGAPSSTVDYSNVGARDTGGGLDGIDERPEQGNNPYEGMSKEQMQAAFAKDMGMQGPQGAGNSPQQEMKVGSPLDTRRHIDTLGYRLDSCEEKAKAAGRNDILNRVETARGNLLYLAQKLKKRAPKDELQRLLDKAAREVQSIQIAVAQQ